MRKTKKVFKLFWPFDLEKKENWLRNMANKGYFFQKINIFGIYTFNKGPCEDIIYKIDFAETIEDINEYYDLFRQSGWEYINSVRHFRFFKYSGDISNFSKEVVIYNAPIEQLDWIRGWLIFWLLLYVFPFIRLFQFIFIQNIAFSNLYFKLFEIAFTSWILAKIINSYKKLKNKISENQYKDYYNKNYLKKSSFWFFIFICSVLICILLFISILSSSTVANSEKAFKNKIIQSQSNSLYGVKKIDYFEVHDIDNYKVCFYGNNDRIGVIALQKSILNRYKLVKETDISSVLPSKNCTIYDGLTLGDNMYSFIYGEDESHEIYKVTFIYRDWTKDEVTQDAFIKKDNYFLVYQSNNKLLRQVKLYNKDNVDITNKYNNK